MFRVDHPLAWTFHRGTSRWTFNMHGLNTPTHDTPLFKENLAAQTIELETPAIPQATFEQLVRRRSSCRQFQSSGIDRADLGTILHAAYGVLDTVDLWGEFCERPVPSGGGLYPLELYVLSQRVHQLDGGVYHYVPLGHRLEVVFSNALPSHLTSEMFLGQPYLVNAAAIIVITAVVQRSFWKYEDRGYRYILLEAGHAAQNINLCTEGLGLASLNLGGFFDEDVMALLRLDRDREIVLYGVALGKPATGDRDERRRPREADGAIRRY